MLGSIVNTAVIIVCSLVGMLLSKGINEKLNTTLMQGMALCVMFVGISGSLSGTFGETKSNVLVLIVSMTIGGLIGELLDLDGRLGRLGDKIEAAVSKGESKSKISEGFVTATMLYCVGAMGIVGSINSGVMGDHSILFAKSLIDGVTSIVLASQLGFGVMLSAIPVFIYQGVITLCAGFIAPYLSPTVIAEMSCIGNVIIIGISLNVLKVTKIKVMNYVPGIFVAAIIALVAERIAPVANFLYG